MKKLFTISTLFLASTLSIARETVTLIYPWGMGDPMANYSRTLIDEANKLQDQYTFLLDNKAGAGGTIAAKHVGTTPNTILAGSTAFFVRPNFYPQESHDVNQFKVLMTQCSVPMVVSSSNYKTWDGVPKNKTINVGVSGLGATTHLIAMEIKQRYPQAEAVPYKSTQASTLDLAGQRLDMNIGFPGEIEQWVLQGKLYALGVTGKKTVNGIPTLHSQGFSSMEHMVNGHSLIVPTTLSDSTYKTWRNIFIEAAKKASVQASYRVDHCDPMTHNEKQSHDWYKTQIELWKQLSNSVPKFNK